MVAQFKSWIALLVLLGGCASWHNETPMLRSAGGLPMAKPGGGAAVLEVTFVPLAPERPITGNDPTESAQTAEDLWHWVDETAIAPEVRAELRRNGLRLGRVHSESEFLRQLGLQRRAENEAERLLSSADVASEVTRRSRRIPCDMGKRYELPVRQPSPGTHATLVSLGGQTVGRSLENPQHLFALSILPSDIGSVRIRLQPEIQHGLMKQTWVSSDSALRIDNRRDSWQLRELALELPLAEGAMLVAGATTPPAGLGSDMFLGTTATGDVDRVVMVLRVASLPKVDGS